MVDSPAMPSDDAESSARPGPRRSTYTPPPPGRQYTGGRSATSTPSPPSASPASPDSAPTGPSSVVPAAFPSDEGAPAGAFAGASRAWVPLNRQPSPDAPAPSPPRPPEDLLLRPPSVSAPPEAVRPETTPAASPLAGLSSEHPVPQAAPGLPIPPPPERASLPDDDLVAVLDPDRAPGNAGALIDLFQEQLELRAREERMLDAWEEEVRRQVGDSADAIVASVRSAYTGVIDIIPAPLTPGASIADPAPPPAPIASAGSAAIPESAPAPEQSATIDPATLTSSDVSSLLAGAPPPDSSQRTVATPPESFDDAAPVPPPLVEPSPPSGMTGPIRVDAWDGLLAPSSDDTDDTDADENVAPVVSPAASSPAAPSSAPAHPGLPPESNSDEPAAATPPAARDTSSPARGPRAFALEQSALEPTPEALRAGRAVRLFWLWFAVNASALTLAVGALLIADGASLRQAVLAGLAGVALSALLLGVVTRTGRWSGQPTIVVGRATFGTVGNALPAALAVAVRVLWAAALLYLLGVGVAEVLVTAGLAGGASAPVVAAIAAAVAFVVASGCATLGFAAVARLGAIAAPLAGVLAVGVVVLTAPTVSLGGALGIADGPWALLMQGTVLVVSVVGLAWVSTGGDLVRYQARSASGSAAALWTAVGIALPALGLIAWGALLAASSSETGEALVENPVAALAALLPGWYAVPLALAIAVSLVVGATLSLYSGGFAMLTLGPPAPRWAGVVIAAALSAAALGALLAASAAGTGALRDLLVVLAVPVAAWAGIVGTETLLRRRRVLASSLLTRSGVYPSARWGVLAGLVAASVVGWGAVSGETAVATWTGYLLPLVTASDSPWRHADAGVIIALLLGVLTAVSALPALRRLEAAEERAAA